MATTAATAHKEKPQTCAGQGRVPEQSPEKNRKSSYGKGAI